MRVLTLALALSALLAAQQPQSAPSAPTVKRLSESQVQKLQILELQYRLLIEQICHEAEFPAAQCQIRAEAGVVIRTPVVPEVAKPKPEPAKPEPSKSPAAKEAK